MKKVKNLKKHWDRVRKAEAEYLEGENLSYEKKLQIFEAMWRHALDMGKIKVEMDEEEFIESISHKIRLARMINSCLSRPLKR